MDLNDSNESQKLTCAVEENTYEAEEVKYSRRVSDDEITWAKINTFVNINETFKNLRNWLSPRQYEMVIHQPCIQHFMKLNTLGWAGQLLHNTLMRLTDHSDNGDALWFQGVLSWEATRAAICATVDNRTSSKRRPLKKSRQVHYSIASFPHALLVWAYESIPTMAAKFTTNYEQTIPRMLSWITADNVKFDEVMWAFTSVGENQGKAQPGTPITSRQSMDVPTNESDALKTTSDDIATSLQDEVLIDSSISAAAILEKLEATLQGNVGEGMVQSDPLDEIKEESMPHPEKGKKEDKDDKIISGQDVVQPASPDKEASTSDVVPKKKRARLSRLGQRPTGSRTEVGSPAREPSQSICALPPSLADELSALMQEEFREWINKGALKKTPPGKRPPRYNAKHDPLDKPHDLGIMEHIDVAFYYLRKKIKQYPNLEQRKVTTVDTFFSSKIAATWPVYQSSPDKFDWGTCETLLKMMLGLSVQSGKMWFDVNTLLIPVNMAVLKHWVLVKLELTDWTMEVYDSLEHEGPHNEKVQEGVEGLSMFIPLFAAQIGLFEFKPREPPGMHPIQVTIMKDIPKQGNGYRKLAGAYKSDDEPDMD
ncbi:hypothetical protein TIFTF001_035301 [Ficus carica]|uniref:Ubiquitin-like protease family profile domain-containing protein n=1 Tax=Ficus carica TaxID=3494 RepID=A0AA88E222_FICCA|nr:hypothetical protein TIFTF001_035301 [Ficus carica]